LICAFSVLYLFEPSNLNADLWCGMLCVQTLPYWAALVVSMINALGVAKTEAPQS
jgi:hypothetical protein